MAIFTEKSTMFELMKNGALVNFTPGKIVGGWQQINTIQGIKDRILLTHMKGNMIERIEFPMTEEGLAKAMATLNL